MRFLPDIFGFGGAGLMTYGLWLVHPAAAFIGSGALLMFLGVMQRKGAK